MSRKKFVFKIVGSGSGEKESTRRCYAAWAPGYAHTLLNKTPGAQAVYASEENGASVFAAYRR